MTTAKSYPINCSGLKDSENRPWRLAEIGIDQHGNFVLFLWCRLHGKPHTCKFEQLLQSWREMLTDDEQGLQSLKMKLKSAITNIDADLEDMAEQDKAAG